MSKNKPVKKIITSQQQVSRNKPAGTTYSRTKKSSGSSFSLRGGTVIFTNENLVIMIAGVVLIGLGMILMMGGGMKDPNEWKPEVIYSTRITVIAPMFILAGLGLQVWSIFKKEKSEDIESL
jgi:hypothetical protein